MRNLLIILHFTGEAVISGMVWGGILGAVAYLIVTQFNLSVFILLLIFYGGFSGIVLGGINGMVLGIITIILHRTSFNPTRYKLAYLLISAVITFACSTIFYYLTHEFYAVMKNQPSGVFQALGGAGITTIVFAFISQDLATIYSEKYALSK